ncbi:MAG TPA: nitroreductase family protein [Flavobacteriales bacterium]|jgi:nitroreductase|nr:nitroreductase family protein [Flavobacteriales bacterium]|tara:strand:+ start:2704 stop:3372 length:669 start_codon:yes stop_codon:yes gene_type:complete
MTNENKFIPYKTSNFSAEELIEKSQKYFQKINKRRSVRDFSDKEVPKEVIENIIKTAGSAPSGAHKQPWTFCVISNKELKSKIRKLAEEEEYENYHGRMSDSWKADLKDFGTDHIKEFLEVAPYLIVVFKKVFDLDEDDNKSQNYYVNESVGIACGFLITAIHQAGLVTLTHTPSPMGFLQKALARPKNEKAFLLLPVGYPAKGCKVPDLKRKDLNEISFWF